VNRTNSDKTFRLSTELKGTSSLTVDEATGDDEPRAAIVAGDTLAMAPFAVTVLKEDKPTETARP